MEKLKQVSIGAWIALSVLIMSCAAVVIWSPPHFWDILGNADWQHIAGVVGLVGTAFVGVFIEWKRRSGAGVVLLGALVLGSVLMGCGGSPYSAARATLASTSRIMATVDRGFAEQRVATAERIAADPNSTREQFRAEMHVFDELLLASLDVRDTALGVQASIDGAERGEASDWLSAMGCFAVAVSRLIGIADRRGLQIPEDLRPIVETVVNLGAVACNEGAGQ